jgi:hypothetical protein
MLLLAVGIFLTVFSLGLIFVPMIGGIMIFFGLRKLLK